MGKRVQRIGHSTAQAAVFTGLDREITVDTGKKVPRVHDGLTPGGIAIAREDLNNTPAAVGGSNDGKMTSTQATELSAATAKDVVQDARMDAIDILDTAQTGRLDAMDTLNTAQDTRMNGIDAVDASQNIRMDAMDAVNSGQDALNTTQNSRLTATEAVADAAAAKNITQDAAIAAAASNIPALTTGTNAAYVAQFGTDTTLTANQMYWIRMHIANTANCTINVNGVGVKQMRSVGSLRFLLTGELDLDSVIGLLWNGVEFIAQQLPQTFIESPYYTTIGAPTTLTPIATFIKIPINTRVSGSNTPNNWDVAATQYGSGNVRVGIYVISGTISFNNVVLDDTLLIEIRNTIGLHAAFTYKAYATGFFDKEFSQVIELLATADTISLWGANNNRATSELSADMRVTFLGYTR